VFYSIYSTKVLTKREGFVQEMLRNWTTKK